MKQYLSSEQTAKLMELGFEKPKSVISYSYPIQSEEQQAYEASLGLDPYLATVDQIEFEYSYSIGELIEMLGGVSEIEITRFGSGWEAGDELRAFTGEELIDNLYDMIVYLKGEGVI